MISLGNDEITKYPFLAEAGEYLKDKGFTLEQFATDPDLQIIVDKAYERVECASWGKIFNSNARWFKGRHLITIRGIFISISNSSAKTH